MNALDAGAKAAEGAAKSAKVTIEKTFISNSVV